MDLCCNITEELTEKERLVMEFIKICKEIRAYAEKANIDLSKIRITKEIL